VTSPIGHVVRAARHPLATAAYVVGVARGAVVTVARIAGVGHDEKPRVPEQRAGTASPARPATVATEVHEPERVLPAEPAPAAPQRAPRETGEAFVTEATAVNRTSAHGGVGRDEEIDDWYGDAEEDDDEPLSIVEILEQNDPLDGPVDESAIKAVISESEILRKAADPDH
jgi:hypothetical protein